MRTLWSKYDSICANNVYGLSAKLQQVLAAFMKIVVQCVIFSAISLKAMLLLLSQASSRLHIPITLQY